MSSDGDGLGGLTVSGNVEIRKAVIFQRVQETGLAVLGKGGAKGRRGKPRQDCSAADIQNFIGEW